MDNIVIKSYLQHGSEFKDVFDKSLVVEDSFYIEGAIYLEINGEVLIDLEMWDLVDQLWAYIVNGMEEIFNGREFVTYFPDQPIEMKFLSMPRNQMKISVNFKRIRSAVVSREEFLMILYKEGKLFLEKLSELAPSQAGAIKTIIDKLNALKNEHIASR